MGTEETESDIHAPCRERIHALEAIVAEQQKLLEEQRRQIQEQIMTLQARVVELERENTELKRHRTELEIRLARARKDSSMSSKPPSSDIVKPLKEASSEGKEGRKEGAQPGRPKHERPAFPPDQIDDVHTYTLEDCPDCGCTLEPSDAAPRVIQQVELVPRPVVIEEHRGEAYWCKRCQKIHYAPLPTEVERAGLSGPTLTALVGYIKGFNVAVQFCMAHLIRDVKFLTTLSDAATRAYGESLLTGLRELFGVIHRRDEIDEGRFQEALESKRQKILQIGLENVPEMAAAQNMARRFHNHGEAYFQFITTPGMDPTNNVAEQAIRFVLIDRMVTQGTRSQKSRQWCQRIWTVLATCVQQGRSAFEFILEAVKADFAGSPWSSLLPAVSGATRGPP